MEHDWLGPKVQSLLGSLWMMMMTMTVMKEIPFRI